MDVIICKTAADAEKLTAQMIADAINAKPEFKLGPQQGPAGSHSSASSL